MTSDAPLPEPNKVDLEAFENLLESGDVIERIDISDLDIRLADAPEFLGVVSESASASADWRFA